MSDRTILLTSDRLMAVEVSQLLTGTFSYVSIGLHQRRRTVVWLYKTFNIIEAYPDLELVLIGLPRIIRELPRVPRISHGN